MTDSTRRKLYEHMNLIKDIRYPRVVNEYCTLIDINDFPEYWKTKALKDYSAAMHREYWLKEHFSRIAVLLDESVSRSLVDDVLRRLREEYGIENWQINPYELYNGIDGYNIEKKNKNTNDNISLLIPELKNNRDIIITVMKQEGYYLICESPDNLDKATNVDWVVLTFAPYEQYKVNDDVAEKNYVKSPIVLTKREFEVKKEIEEEVSKCPNIHFNGRTVYTTSDNFDELMKVKSHLMMKGIICNSNETLRKENMSFFDVRLRKSDEMKNRSVFN